MHHDLKTILKDDNTTESVSQDQLKKRGVDALSDSPKNRLKNNLTMGLLGLPVGPSILSKMKLKK